MHAHLNKVITWFKDIGSNKFLREILLLIVVWLALVSLAAFEALPTPNLKVGEPSPKDIEAPRNFQMVDEGATLDARLKAAKAVGTLYSFETEAINQVEQNLSKTFAVIKEVKGSKNLSLSSKIAKINQSLKPQLSDSSLKTLLEQNPTTLAYMEMLTKDILKQAMHQSIKHTDIQQAKLNIKKMTAQYDLPSNISSAIVEVAQKNLIPNLVPNIKLTIESQQNEMNKVEPILHYFAKGQIIIRKGDPVTAAHIEILHALGKTSLNFKKLSGFMLFALMFIFLILVYIARQAPQLMQEKQLMLLSLITVSTIAVCKWTIQQTNPYLAPVAAASILISILMDLRLALLVSALISGYVGIFAVQYFPAIISFLTAGIAALSVSKVSKRWDLVSSCLVVALANTIAVLAFELIAGEDWIEIATAALSGGLNGLLSGIIAIGVLPFFENFFGITTHIKLLEHSNPTEPLLQKLLLEAPGTYHHSIVVANLAENAAQSIGADALLARVGAYFHDIGKIKRPYFFIENLLGGENPHDKLAPSLSTLIISSHVKDGLDLAKQYHLPQPIVNIITSHHGNNVIAYFYHQAKLKNPQISEQDFRYNSPKPHSKEAAIIMLADSVEAAARALSSNNPNKLEMLVNQIIKENLADGQLDESELSFKDLTVISNAFIRILTSIYHTRIEYPEKLSLDAIKTGAPGK